MPNYTTHDLEAWDERIRDKVKELGLDVFPQDFEFCNHHQMLGYMAYSGMPARYPHWSFGKSFERQKTLYDYGLAGLPYEMVINSNPSLAYLMSDNSLLLQILTIAHVYAHNDFFKNNFNFRSTHPEYTLESFKTHAARVRSYVENSNIGQRSVEDVLDAAHALSLSCRRFNVVRRDEPATEQLPLPVKPLDRFGRVAPPDSQQSGKAEQPTAPPMQPDHDLLLFLRDHNPDLKDWQRDLLAIAHEEAVYFIPQIETKIMNEGWASFWHKRIMESLELPSELRLEFMVRHNQVLRPIPRSLNPYYVGFKIFEDIERRWDSPSPEEREEFGRSGDEGTQKIFQVREADRDESFLRQYLTLDLMRDMDLYRHEKRGENRVISHVASDEDWKLVRSTVIQSVGMNSQPAIAVVDANFQGRRRLLLKHDFDGRTLDPEYARRTLEYVRLLWGGMRSFETVSDGRQVHLESAA